MPAPYKVVCEVAYLNLGQRCQCAKLAMLLGGRPLSRRLGVKPDSITLCSI